MTQERKLTIVPENIDGTLNVPHDETEVVRASYCYLHGDLQDLNGYDIFSLLKSELTSDEIQEEHWVSDNFGPGIYSCICLDRECTFFRWWNGRHHSGLVVLNSDKESFEYAKQCYESKAPSI